MDSRALADGLLMYLGLLVLLTFHEFGHAWTAWRCGDDTARLQGRVSLNPLVHIDPIGTVLLPLLGMFTGFFIGWAKPVPVNPYNLRHPKRDDLLVTLAGPGMNVLLAIILVALMRIGFMIHSTSLVELCLRLADLSLLLCFFNLIPVPPLDGSQVLRVLTNMSYETYHNFARFGFLIVIVMLQFRPFSQALSEVTHRSLYGLMSCFGMSA